MSAHVAIYWTVLAKTYAVTTAIAQRQVPPPKSSKELGRPLGYKRCYLEYVEGWCKSNRPRFKWSCSWKFRIVGNISGGRMDDRQGLAMAELKV